MDSRSAEVVLGRLCVVVIALVLGACGPGKTAPAAWEKSLSPFRVMKENPPIRKVPIPFRQDGPPLEAAPAITPKPLRLLTPTSPPTSVPEHEVEMDIIIVVDNYPSRPGWETTWGFSALVEVEGRLLLFDTGGDGPLLLRNLARQDVDPHSIRQVVISHAHRDHTGGIASLLSTRGHPELYLPPDLVEAYRSRYGVRADVYPGESGKKLSDRVYLTGMVGKAIPEQALILDHPRGLVIITGCAHPGVVEMARAAKRALHKEPYLVLGGFHLREASDREIHRVIQGLKRLGVEQVGPCHCSGDRARELFREGFGAGYLDLGTGQTISLP